MKQKRLLSLLLAVCLVVAVLPNLTSAVTYEEEIHLGDTVEVTVQPDESVYLPFTLVETDTYVEYVFYSKGNDNVLLYLCDTNGVIYTGGSERVSCYLNGGTWCWWVVNETSVEQTYVLHFDIAVPAEVVMERETVYAYVGDSFWLNYSLAPDNARNEGWISWTSDNEAVATVDHRDITCVGVGEANITVTLKGGATGTCKVIVQEPKVIQPGFEETVTLDNLWPTNRAIYSCTPTENGTYIFYTTRGGGFPACLTIYDQNGSYAEITNVFSNAEFEGITCDMEKGKTYTLVASNSYGSDEPITRTVGLNKYGVPAESLSINGLPEESYLRDTVYTVSVSTSPWYAVEDTYTWTVSDTSVVSIEESVNSEYAFLYVQEAGTATITVTSNTTGISGSATITVNDALRYSVIEGDSEVVAGSGDTLTVHFDGEIEDFLYVFVDGEWVDETDYTVTEGSTIVTLSAEYLETLSEGTHTLTVMFSDGVAETTFTILASTEPNPTEPTPTEPEPTEPEPTEPTPTEPEPTEPTPTEPKPTEPTPTEPVESDNAHTGNGDSIYLFIALAIITGTGLTAIAIVERKRFRF